MSHGNILHKVNNAVTPLYAFTDNLGSVTRLYTENGTEKFRAQYDPWGVQVVNRKDVNFARGYCGHEMLNDFQLINMNGRMYDPVLGRFLSPDNYVQMPTSAQSFNRYSYCLNNPLRYVDPDGELFRFSLVTGFIHGLVKFVEGGKITDPFTYMYKNVVNELKVDWGMIAKGSLKQILSRFTWELPQTFAGYMYTQYRFATHYIDHVGYYDGATYVYHKANDRGFGGVTLGNLINIDTREDWPTDKNGKFNPEGNYLFMHEYGHYIQSQEYGWGYLFSVGIPSLISSIKDNGIVAEIQEALPINCRVKVSKHRTEWYELSANNKASSYFKNKGVTWNDKNYPLSISKIYQYSHK